MNTGIFRRDRIGFARELGVPTASGGLPSNRICMMIVVEPVSGTRIAPLPGHGVAR